MNAKTIKKFEEKLAYLKMKQELLEELISEVKESSKERDFVEGLTELVTGLEKEEVLIYGTDWNTIEDVEYRDALAGVIHNHIRNLRMLFDPNYKRGDEKK